MYQLTFEWHCMICSAINNSNQIFPHIEICFACQLKRSLMATASARYGVPMKRDMSGECFIAPQTTCASAAR